MSESEKYPHQICVEEGVIVAFAKIVVINARISKSCLFIILNYAALKLNIYNKFLSDNTLFGILPCQIFHLFWCCKSKHEKNHDTAKICIKCKLSKKKILFSDNLLKNLLMILIRLVDGNNERQKTCPIVEFNACILGQQEYREVFYCY